MHNQMRQNTCVYSMPIPSCLRLVWLSDFSTPLSLSNNCLTRFLVGKFSSRIRAFSNSSGNRTKNTRWKNVLNCLFSTNISGFCAWHCVRHATQTPPLKCENLLLNKIWISKNYYFPRERGRKFKRKQRPATTRNINI